MYYPKSINLLAIGVGAYASLGACSFSPLPTDAAEKSLQGQLTITGASTVEPLVSQIAKRFEAHNPQVTINIKTKDQFTGLEETAKEKVDIGMVSRALTPSEKKAFQDFAIAREGIGIIVHQDNPLDALRHIDILNIYTGRIDNWREVGGTNNSIRVVHKSAKNSTQELFLNYFQLNNSQIEVNAVGQDNLQKIETIASNPDAIGYASIAIAEYNIANGVPIKLLPVSGIEATTAAVQDGSFPLSRPLNLVTKTEPSGLAKKFIKFAQSEKVHDLVTRHYFFPINNEVH